MLRSKNSASWERVGSGEFWIFQVKPFRARRNHFEHWPNLWKSFFLKINPNNPSTRFAARWRFCTALIVCFDDVSVLSWKHWCWCGVEWSYNSHQHPDLESADASDDLNCLFNLPKTSSRTCLLTLYSQVTDMDVVPHKQMQLIVDTFVPKSCKSTRRANPLEFSATDVVHVIHSALKPPANLAPNPALSSAHAHVRAFLK